MKKFITCLSVALFSLFILFSVVSCNNESKEKDATFNTANIETLSNSGVNTSREYVERQNSLLTEEEFFFTELDYTPQVPEKESIPGRIPVVSSAADVKDSSIIPGIRNLSDYAINYATTRLTAQPKSSSVNAGTSASGQGSVGQTGISKVLKPLENATSESVVQDERIEPIRITNITPGKRDPSTEPQNAGYWYYNSSVGVPPNRAQSCFVIFNYPLTKEEVLSELTIKETLYDTKKVYDSLTYSAVGEFDENIYGVELSTDKKNTNAYYITIKQGLHTNSKVTIDTKNSTKSSTYDTLVPFSFEIAFKQGGKADQVKPHCLRFTQEIDESTVISGIHISGIPSFSGKLTKNNFEVNDQSVVIFNLPVKNGDEYKIEIDSNLKDIYKQPLSNNTSVTVSVTEDFGYTRFDNYGNRMLEAQFPHKILFEYMNPLRNSVFKLAKIDNPLISSEDLQNVTANIEAIPLDLTQRDIRQFAELDLEPYLTNGYGFVGFNASVYTNDVMYDGKERVLRENSYLTLQVTDLGVTVRYGINQAVVMVRSLSNNKPVQGAKVNFYLNDISEVNSATETEDYVTDANGLVTIPMSKYSGYFKKNNDIAILVRNGDDAVTFYPDSHSPYFYGVNTSSFSQALNGKPRIFVFSDRGIYKPGETVTFRGIDRTQQFGGFIPYKGKYNVEVKKDSWSDDNVYANLQGETSVSGGFWGSFKLPDDLEPGNYYAYYSREEDPQRGQRVEFTVSYFERVKVQSSVTVPKTLLYAGDTISAELAASYLAGGVLGGASYEVNWYKEPCTFKSENIEYASYMFGPENVDESRLLVSNFTGQLTTAGSASLSCKTDEGTTKGSPYRYKIETYVTDESNQRLSTSQSVVIHPDTFYIGLAKPDGVKGFAQKGQELSFPYVLVTADGNKVESKEFINKDMKVELSREYWTVSYQNSVNDTVYARYTKNIDNEYSTTVKTAASGKLKVTPKNAGWYTLRVSSGSNALDSVVTEYSFYATGSGASCWYSNSGDMLRLTPDQSQYNPGDNAKILMESTLPSGDYLITVEREGIFTQEVRHFDEPSNVIEIPISRNYLPVVYVSVSSYSVRQGEPTHEYGEKDLGKPKSYYGVTPIFINPRVKAFSVDVESDKTYYRPGEQVSLKLKATKGGEAVSGAELTVMVVDRGVTDLIDYHVPNPIDFFYNSSNYPLYTRGGDSRDLLIDPVTYSIRNLQGGDAYSNDKEEDERKDFRPTAYFEPAIVTDEEGNVECTFKLPDSLTAYRITVFGVDGENLALQEDEIAVQNKMNVQAVQSRRLRVRDTSECGVLITNLDSTAHDVTVSINARKPNGNTAEDEAAGRITIAGDAMIDGKTEHTINVASGNSSVVYFDVAALAPGTVELVYTISSDVINETLVSPILIEKTYVMETVASLDSIEPGENGSGLTTEGVVIPSFAENNQGRISVTLDASRLGLLGPAVNYCFDYPYECLEQQATRVLPLVLFEKSIDILGLNSKISNVRSLAISYFKKWEKEQKDDGGFTYWSDTPSSDLYVSLRIAHLYALAMERGYSTQDFPINIEKLKSYIALCINENIKQTDMSGEGSLPLRLFQHNNDYINAYACYIFGLLGDRRLDGVVNNIAARCEYDLSVSSYVALAYLHQNTPTGKAEASKIAANISKYLKMSSRSVDVVQPGETKFVDLFYNTRISQEALIMQLYVELNPKDEVVDHLLFTLLQEQNAGYWTSTAVTARVLESISSLIQKRNLEATNFTASASIQDTPLVQGSFSGVSAKTITGIAAFDVEPFNTLPRNTTIPLIFAMNGTGTLYYTTEMKYALPDEMQSQRNEGFAVSYKIIDVQTGKEVKPEKKGIYVYTLESGKVYNNVVSISTSSARNFVAVRSPIPSGAEVLNSQFVTTGSDAQMSYDYSGYNSSISKHVVYDNEVQLFWNFYAPGTTTFTYAFRANRRGVYPVPPLQAECMYESEVFGRSDGNLFIIK